MIKKKNFLLILTYFIILTFPGLVKLVSPSTPEQLIPSFYILTLWCMPLLLISQIQNVFAVFLSMLWVAWFIAGGINLIASYEYYGTYYLLDANMPALVYTTFFTVFLAALTIYEKISNSAKKRWTRIHLIKQESLKGFNPLFATFLILFPFAWFGSVYASLGYIPIVQAFQGIDLTPELYGANYGNLYGYSLVIILSTVLISDKLYSKSPKKCIALTLLLIFIAFLVSTGKRHWLILAVVALLIYQYRLKHITPFKLATILAGVTIFYALLIIVRQGVNISKYTTVSGQLILVGSEYRAFAYTVNHFKPGEIDAYDWGKSAIAASMNSAILKAMRVDKKKLVELDSARTWRYIFSSPYGIRSGIISELYMAYGFVSCVIIFIFGFLVGWIANHLQHTPSKKTLAFQSVCYGIITMSIVGQTTDMVGSLTLLLYIWILSFILELVTPIFSKTKSTF